MEEYEEKSQELELEKNNILKEKERLQIQNNEQKSIIQSKENQYNQIQLDFEQTKNHLESKIKQLEDRLKDVSNAKKEDIDENEKYLLLNGIIVTLKMANPDYADTSYSVSSLFNEIKKENVPLPQWPLFIAGTLGQD
ncbi:hypothetical protein EHI_024890 [Entamoeba histolytica HM-1:IMSS]|uniref:GRIP domain-containing protein n=1 Tax=Entamoeba histolytica (strain ATCC 30459 / HM-1:IMSS / ABRM) TaxID=294381 RepID=B1N5X4_ENTH1|nr:hypothetical protein EHI_024890 [Entamoeba histolytica HM-1:IMSS]EDS88634.1 hypothetical protein EHI_024890 [Entamoeba histolytica HM-1:IMSS]|eukprot:XP_001914590.1 hypothetical protein EHI_024890 [Entamoeba histolytica HM-1:IMSS]